MIRKKSMRTFVSLLGFLICTTAIADHSSSVDSDGCWDAKNRSGGSCISTSSRWSKYTDDKLIVTYTNECSHRIYITKCNERNNGSWDCGSGGISPGNSTNWNTGDASGAYEWVTVGSDRGSKDWVCAGKHPDWDIH